MVGCERVFLQTRYRSRERADAAVDALAGQALGELVRPAVLDGDMDARMELEEPTQQAWEDGLCSGGGRCDAQASATSGGNVGHAAPHAFDFRQRALCISEGFGSCSGASQRARRALKEPYPEALLQLTQQHSDRWLRERQKFCRGGDLPALVDGDKRPELSYRGQIAHR